MSKQSSKTPRTGRNGGPVGISRKDSRERILVIRNGKRKWAWRERESA